jgi:hypothetical protein
MQDPSNEKGVGVGIQLSAVSEFESKMYGSDVGLLKSLYSRHSNFDKEPIETPEQEVLFNEKLIFTLPTDVVDMISDLFLKVKLPNIEMYPAKWTNSIGHSCVEYVSIYHEDEEVVRYTSEYMHVMFMLSSSSSKHAAQREMIQHKHNELAINGKSKYLLIEIPFFKSVMDKQMFPIMLAKKEAFQIVVKFKPISKCLFIEKDTEVQVKLLTDKTELCRCIMVYGDNAIVKDRDNIKIKCSLFYDGYHLTENEIKLFKNEKSDILFRSVEYRKFEWGSRQFKKIAALDFSTSVSEILFCVRDDVDENVNRCFKFKELDKIEYTFRGIQKQETPAKGYHWNKTHKRVPSSWIYSLPFCLSSVQTQPSGQRKFSGKKDRSSIDLTRNDNTFNSKIFIFALTYKLLRFDKGGISFHTI